jgi:hypothetical protein
MSNIVDEIIVPILQQLQVDMGQLQADTASIKSSVGRLETRLEETNAQLAAFRDMTEARFIGIEHAVLDVSARAYMTAVTRRSS